MRRQSILHGHRLAMILAALVCATFERLSWLPIANAFSSSGDTTMHRRIHCQSTSFTLRRTSQSRSPSMLPLNSRQRTSKTELLMGDDWWNSLKGLFDGLSDAFNNGRSSDKSSDDDDTAAGTSLIASIPVQSLKPGGLRLFLMFYLMGMQNTPDKGSWKAHQPDSAPSPMTQYSSSTPTLDDEDNDDEDSAKQPSDEFESPYVLEMFYKDASAMISIELLPHKVQIQRCGSLPSTSYLMQETVLVEGILDELEKCAFDDSVDEDKRLLLLSSPDGIDSARSTLSFA